MVERTKAECCMCPSCSIGLDCDRLFHICKLSRSGVVHVEHKTLDKRIDVGARMFLRQVGESTGTSRTRRPLVPEKDFSSPIGIATTFVSSVFCCFAHS